MNSTVSVVSQPPGPSQSGRWSARRWHKWAGLAALAWLGVLGATGFILNHREDWDWIWQRGVPVRWLPDQVVRTAESSLARFLQVDPADGRRQVAAGVRGAWWSGDGGQTWQPSAAAVDQPLVVMAVEPEPDWSAIWFGTSDGVWVSRDRGRSLQRHALAGVRVSALGRGSSPGDLLGVEDRRRVFRLATAPAAPAVAWLPLGPAAGTTSAPGADLSRLTLDLHYGRGLFGAPWDEWINDLAGLGLVVLSLTGLLLWWLPWRWRRRRAAGRPRPAVGARRSALVWLVGAHAKWLGPVLLVPLAGLFVTGVYIGHFTALSPLFKATPVRPAALPPTYAMNSWDDWIECIAAYPEEPARFSLGTRTGLYTTGDSGRTWHAETGVKGGVLRLRWIGGELLAPNGMSGTAQRRTAQGWTAVAPAGSHLAMASEVSGLSEGRLLWKHGAMLHVSDADGREVSGQSFRGPRATLVPFYTVASRLHSGVLFFKQWYWINDAFALAGLVLLGTGLLRWWRLVRPGPN